MRKTLMMLVAGLVLAGCGGGAGKATTTTATSPPANSPPTTSPETAAKVAACQKVADQALGYAESQVQIWRDVNKAETAGGADPASWESLRYFVGQAKTFIEVARAGCRDFKEGCPDPADEWIAWVKGTYDAMLDTTSPTTVDPGPPPPINCS